MLTHLTIENIAVIERADVDFSRGMTVLTGETGAGKSILIDSIHAVLGGRISRDLIRTGAKSACVTAVFERIPRSLAAELEEQGVPVVQEEDTLILQREIRAGGKSLCRINMRPVTVAVLAAAGAQLLTIHGQHESYELLDKEQHRGYVDAMGQLEPLRQQYRQVYGELRAVQKSMDALLTDEEEKSRRADLLRYEIEELENGAVTVGEQEQLQQKRTLFRNSEKMAGQLHRCREALQGGEEPGAVELLQQAADAAEEAAHFLPQAESWAAQLRSCYYDLQALSEEEGRFSGLLDFDPEEMARVEERLDVLYRLGLKYGRTEEEMLAYLEKAKRELLAIEHADEELERLQAQFEEKKAQAIALARELSHRRRDAALELTRRVSQELAFLDMPGVCFRVEQVRCPLNEYGCDRIQFLISTNPGEEPKPLSKIASGGELSRIMLALKTVLACLDPVDTMIFDEVDAGISGSAARKVGQKLHEVAENVQVLCVTHTAQIAAMAHHQFWIRKEVEDGKTYTRVQPLSREERVRQIARLISGGELTPILLQNAEEMLKMGENGA